MLKKFYAQFVLKYPWLVIILILVAIAFFGYEATKLEVDASAETLVLEDDKDLKFSRTINARYETQDFLVIAFTPNQGLLEEKTFEVLRSLKKDLEALEGVESVLTLLNVPLLESPPKPVKELIKDVPTIETHEVDLTLAKKELLNSPIYRKLLVSPDFKTTILQVNIPDDETYRKHLNRRYELRDKEKEGTLTPEEALELEEVQIEFKKHRDRMRELQHINIKQVREVIKKYDNEGELFLGGVSMIADDLVTFVESDLKIFGLGVLIFLIITLWIIFRQIRWILLPILCCLFSVIATCGILGMFGWEVTVISSNFISLQIIITMAITIHLIVRYRELVLDRPDASQFELVLEATHSMAKPCAFAILTTMAGFCSLLLSGILPVINFGWMMTTGIGVSLILTFLIFPSTMILVHKSMPNTSFEKRFTFTRKLADLTEKRGKAILWVSAGLLLFCIVGSSRLMVENSFIDYFKESTEIYQGMKVIDQQLGGTTPFDVVLDFPEEEEAEALGSLDDAGEDAEFDAFEAEFEEMESEAQYWFTSDKMAEVERIHDYLDSIPETGKVLSLGTMLKVGRTLNDGEPLDNFLLALVYNELPERFRKIILNPYVSVDDNQVRFSVRIRDSEPDLRRNELLKQIRKGLKEDLGFGERVRVTGILVLYNNMLQSLFDSQILTLGAVILALMIMFLILFRSFSISVIAIFPNILSVGVVLGFMGWVGIPLDMMTITIAAISVGIAVDDTIHYIHRFIKEFEKDKNYIASMHRCHESIGYAMYYTSVTIVIGFSILVLSNFIPSIYFGLLTGLAMVIALFAALTLLPQLFVFIKPLGPGNGK